MFETVAGYWSPIVLVASAFVAVVIALYIREKGNKNFKKTNAQALPFFSGNVAPEKNIGIGNLYWGFEEAMKEYYALVEKIHNGMVNDFVFWFVLLVIILLTSFVLGGIPWA